MPNRDSIHKLVDSLPEEALETAERLLRSSQTWQPAPTLDVPAMRRRVRQMFTRGPDEHGMKLVKELESKLERKGGAVTFALVQPRNGPLGILVYGRGRDVSHLQDLPSPGA